MKHKCKYSTGILTIFAVSATMAIPSSAFKNLTHCSGLRLCRILRRGVAQMRRFLWLLMPVLLTGCTAEDAAGVKIDLSQLNWQTAAIIAFALLVSPGKIIGQLTGQLAKVPGLEKVLRLIGVIRSPDGSPAVLTQAEVLEALVAIVNRMPQSPLRDEIAKLLTKAATAPEVSADAK